MTIQELRRRFGSGEIDKPTYIRAMLEQHQRLFEYAQVLGETDIASIEITGAGVRFRLRDLPFRMTCPAAEARVAPLEIINFDHYEAAETKAVLPLLAGCSTVLDIGANIGWFSLWFTHHAPQAHVHAFEPIPENLRYLMCNVADNGLEQRISVHALGLSEQEGRSDFFVYPSGSTNVSLTNVSGAHDAVRVVARTERLDDWAQRNGVRPDFIKCDVEGAELLVFRGARRVLREARPVVFAEMLRKWSQPFGYHPNDMIAFFGTLDYRCMAVGSDGLTAFEHMTEASTETNFLFLPRERRDLPGA